MFCCSAYIEHRFLLFADRIKTSLNNRKNREIEAENGGSVFFFYFLQGPSVELCFPECFCKFASVYSYNTKTHLVAYCILTKLNVERHTHDRGSKI